MPSFAVRHGQTPVFVDLGHRQAVKPRLPTGILFLGGGSTTCSPLLIPGFNNVEHLRSHEPYLCWNYTVHYCSYPRALEIKLIKPPIFGWRLDFKQNGSTHNKLLFQPGVCHHNDVNWWIPESPDAIIAIGLYKRMVYHGRIECQISQIMFVAWSLHAWSWSSQATSTAEGDTMWCWWS